MQTWAGTFSSASSEQGTVSHPTCIAASESSRTARLAARRRRGRGIISALLDATPTLRMSGMIGPPCELHTESYAPLSPVWAAVEVCGRISLPAQLVWHR
jgi:hypothetical protein